MIINLSGLKSKMFSAYAMCVSYIRQTNAKSTNQDGKRNHCFMTRGTASINHPSCS